MERSAGVLVHLTSLPARYGIGTLGKTAHRLATAIADAGQRWWQMLPVGPTGYRDSPYQSPSTFAGNPLLIDLEVLVEEGWLRPSELGPLAHLPQARVDFAGLIPAKTRLLSLAARRFLRTGGDGGYQEFVTSHWLDEYATFAALKQLHGKRAWVDWEQGVALRDPATLARFRRRLAGPIEIEKAIQYLFHRQWESMHAHCRNLGVGLIGDVPIFVAHDSADVWSHQELFHLDPDGRPQVVAGVPPDYFSATGQRWGNPLYRWDRHAADGYSWWTQRLGDTLHRFDMIRIDHFRGFVAYWEIPAAEDTAANGHWVDGPGDGFFATVEQHLGRLPIIAEDLGIITEEVTNLRRKFGYPGMRVAQFGFDEELDTALHHPANYQEDVVAYTGTHDNDTTMGWFWGDNPRHDRRRLNLRRRRLLTEVGTKGEEINWDLAALVHHSRAILAVLPVQDLLGAGREGRMNTPGTEADNWTWRMPGQVPPAAWERLQSLTSHSGRLH
jgi:4-alpha-glucanotransferase